MKAVPASRCTHLQKTKLQLNLINGDLRLKTIFIGEGALPEGWGSSKGRCVLREGSGLAEGHLEPWWR